MELPDIPREPLEEEKAICIIGAGPSGLAALKTVLDTPQFKRGIWKPTAYEARDKVGGVWNPAAPTENPPLTPLYDSLTTNLPHPVMAYTSFSFPPSTPLFPRAEYVQRYLEAYADHFDLNPHIQLQTSVTLVERDSGRWKVKLSTGEIRLFDLLVVSNGHYRVPRYPDVPGLDQWLKQNKAMHSAWYRRPQEFGKTVLVIGAGPSGLDISSEMAEHAEVVIHSVTGSTPEQIGNIKRRGRVSEFRDDGQVVFEDGLVEKDIDYCILATGYEMSFPFLPDGVLRTCYPPAVPPIPKHVFNSTYSVFPLAKHIFPLSPLDFTPNSIAFMGLLIKVAPLPLVEAQARMIVHAFAHPEALDSTQESIDVVTRYEAILAELGGEASTKSIYGRWHVFKELEQFDYRDELYRISDVSGTGKEGIEGRVVVADWEKEMYIKKGVLRKFWVDLEKKGVADDWVRDVGKGGLQEWVDLMRKILKEAEKEEVEPDEKSKL